jgi:GNAT superfamily N-acetyltransferase
MGLDTRRWMRLNLVDGPAVPEVIQATPEARPPTGDDNDMLALLLWESTRTTIDGTGGDLDGARAEIGKLMDGDHGDWQPDVSEVVDHGGVLRAATLITRREGVPYVAFCLTLPAFRRRGLARAGLLRTARRLWESGEPELSAVVTRGNIPAEALCDALGFAEVARPAS